MKIIKYIVTLVVAIQFASCTKEKGAEPFFNLTPTERENFKKKELSDALLSSPFGWKLVYFTDNTQLGGFTHLFKFKDSKNVDMASDFDDESIKVKPSEYAIQLGNTVALVFTTKNSIHLLSDSGNAPTVDLIGQGYKGDFQFLYYGQDRGELVFKTSKDNLELRFVKATENDWKDLPKNRAMVENVVGAPTRPLFRFFEIKQGINSLQFDFSYASQSRFAIGRSIVPGSNDGFGLGVAYTPTGISVSPALGIGDQNLSLFNYDATTGDFVATGTNGLTASIKYSSKPLVLTNDYKMLLAGNTFKVYGYIDANLANATTNSALFNALVKEVNAGLPAGIKLSRVQLFFNDGDFSYIGYRFTGGKTTIYHNINTSEDAVNKTIIFSDVSWESNTGAPLTEPDYLKNLDDQFMTPSGLYVKKENFRIQFGNDIFTFTSASSPFRMTTYAFQ
jgi:Domain of unknown function (DUF4302)